MRNFVLTSTSVTDGHPDKLCDRISDAIVDTYLTRDPSALVVAECAIASAIVFVATSAETSASVDVPGVVRKVVSETGYHDPDFNASNVTVLSTAMPPASSAHVAVSPGNGQPKAQCVNTTVFGFACRQTREMLPVPIALAHRFARRLRDVRTRGEIGNLHPDGQVQVAVRYADRKPVSIEGITVYSALREGQRGSEQLAEAVRNMVIAPLLRDAEIGLARDVQIAINPQGARALGGPARHAGLTGRKLDIDCYGGYSRQGGSALSGKDPSRIDRTGAYAARYAAKNIVAAGLAEECEVQISYALSQAEPVSVEIDTFGTSRVPEERVGHALRRVVDFNADAIEALFRLNVKPEQHQGLYFERLGAFGHFGRDDIDLPWEKTDLARAIADNA